MKTVHLASLFLFLAFLVALHHYVSWGVWFELEDLHHETFVVALLFAGLVLLFLPKRRK